MNQILTTNAQFVSSYSLSHLQSLCLLTVDTIFVQYVMTIYSTPAKLSVPHAVNLKCSTTHDLTNIFNEKSEVLK